MAGDAPAAPAAPAALAKPRKKRGPSLSQLIVKALSACEERGGVSFAALKKALAAAGYDVDKNGHHVKLCVKGLVSKGTLIQTKGSGALGSYKVNKPAKKRVDKAKKRAAAKKRVAAKKSPKKVKKPAAAKKAAKSPKKVSEKPAAAKKASPKKK